MEKLISRVTHVGKGMYGNRVIFDMVTKNYFIFIYYYVVVVHYTTKNKISYTTQQQKQEQRQHSHLK